MKGLPKVADTRITSAEFGDYHYQRFLQWSFCDRQSKAALLRNLAVSRTDANQTSNSTKLEFYAEQYGLTLDALMVRIDQADRANMSVAKLHETLTAEAAAKRVE